MIDEKIRWFNKRVRYQNDMSQKRIFAIIGGSGVYEINDNMSSQEVETPFGSVTVHSFLIDKEKCYFLNIFKPCSIVLLTLLSSYTSFL